MRSGRAPVENAPEPQFFADDGLKRTSWMERLYMMDRAAIDYKEKLRTGYTTGACAAAAAKAAALACVSGRQVDAVEISLPCGQAARFSVASCDMGENGARASVIKDAGDDPDVTHGACIIAMVQLTKSGGIIVDGGEGVARVTRSGLGLALGTAAINPVPRANITAMVEEALAGSEWGGARVVISVADGAVIAQGTINERLGLVGGISILGTSGIVRPFSHAAFIKTIEAALAVAREAGIDRLVFTTGTRSERFAMAALASLPPQAFVQVADFMGDALRMAVAADMPRVDICVLIGKLSKLAAGRMATHVKDGEMDLPFLAEVARQAGVAVVKVESIAAAITGRSLFDLLEPAEYRKVGRLLCAMARDRVREHIGGGLDVRLVLFDFAGQVIAGAGCGEDGINE